MSVHLHILDVSKDGTTGHLTVHAKVVDSDDPVQGDGIPETFGISAQELAQHFDGSVEKWLRRRVGRELHGRHVARTAIHDDAVKFRGQAVCLDEEVYVKENKRPPKPKPEPKPEP